MNLTQNCLRGLSKKLSHPTLLFKLCIFEVDKKVPVYLYTMHKAFFLQRQLTLTIEPFVRKTLCSVEVSKTSVKLPEDGGNALQGYVQQHNDCNDPNIHSCYAPTVSMDTY